MLIHLIVEPLAHHLRFFFLSSYNDRYVLWILPWNSTLTFKPFVGCPTAPPDFRFIFSRDLPSRRFPGGRLTSRLPPCSPAKPVPRLVPLGPPFDPVPNFSNYPTRPPFRFHLRAGVFNPASFFPFLTSLDFRRSTFS